MSSKDWTEKMKRPSSAAAEFLKPFAGAPEAEIKSEVPHKAEQPSGEDFIDAILVGQKDKRELTLTGVYLQQDVLDILNQLAKQGGRGAKSRIVNDALRKWFAEKNLL